MFEWYHLHEIVVCDSFMKTNLKSSRWFQTAIQSYTT